jgi:CRP/FNR family transcriptional regulator, cyclic AMP receptor protein
MIERFGGENRQKRIIAALSSQNIIQYNNKLAEEFAKKVILKELKAGEILIAQGESDNDIYFQ